ncbi:19339_t:CDS:2, partial [Funneliformis geosporum]
MGSGVNARESENTMRKTVEYLYNPNSGAEAMRIGYELLQQTLAEKASKLQRPDNSPIRASYTSTVEASISFKKTDYFDAVIGITNIVTLVNVEAFIQMIFQIHD